MVLAELKRVLVVSRREHLLSNQRLADIWDDGYRRAKRELEQTGWEVSLTLARPPTQLWLSNALGRYSASKDQKNELLGPFVDRSEPACRGGNKGWHWWTPSVNKPKYSQSQGLLAGIAVGKAGRNAEFRIRKTDRKKSSQLVSQRRNFGKAQSIFLLNFGQRGGGVDLCSTRYAASSLNLPFENAKCVY